MHPPRIACSIGLLLLLLLLPIPVRAASVTLRTLALSGDPVSGVAGASFASFDTPAIDAAGNVVSLLVIAGPDGNVQALSRFDAGGGDTILAARGEPAPGGPAGAELFVMQFPSTSASGHVALAANLALGPGVTLESNEGLWIAGPGGGFALAAREGDTAPFPIPRAFGRLPSALAISDSGATAFSAEWLAPSGTVAGTGVWRASQGGTVSNLLFAGTPAPGPSGTSFRDFGRLATNDDGDLAFLASIGTLSSITGTGLFVRDTTGTARTVALDGQIAPGAGGATFQSVDVPTINDAGQVIFTGDLLEVPGRGIWSYSAASGLELVVRDGDPIPGAPGESFVSVSPGNLNDAGEIAFAAGDAIWKRGSDGTLASMASRDDVADLLGVSFLRLYMPSLAEDGDVAFFVEGGDTQSGAGWGDGIFFANAAGELTKVAGSGDLLEVAAGDLRVVESLSMWVGDSYQHTTSFNDRDQIAFYARFTDGTRGLFVATVPEPSTALLVAAGVALLAQRRHQR